MLMPDPMAGLPPRLLRTPDAARFLGISNRTLEKHRIYGTGPVYRKMGGRVVYAVEDLQAWSAIGARKSTTDQTAQRVFPARRSPQRDRAGSARFGVARAAVPVRHRASFSALRVRQRSIGGPGKRAAPSGPLSTCARRSRTMLADPRRHKRHDRPSCDRPAPCHKSDASPGYGWRFRESARRRACAEVVAADLPSGRASTSPSVYGSRAAGGDSASRLTVAEKRRLGACRICAHVLTAPRNPSVKLCQSGSNGLAGAEQV